MLDEVETLQRVRGDVRDKALNALRQLIDEVDSGRYPGLYLLITGTPAFFDGPVGSAAACHRWRSDSTPTSPPTPDSTTRARCRCGCPGSTRAALLASWAGRFGTCTPTALTNAVRVRTVVDDAYLASLADAVTGSLGGKVGVAPRVFLKKLVADVLDRVDQFADFDPASALRADVGDGDLTDGGAQCRAPAARADDDRARAGHVRRRLMTGFDALHPVVQHHVVNTLGWSRAAAAAGRRRRAAARRRGRAAARPDRGRQDRGGAVPAADAGWPTRIWRGTSVLYVVPAARPAQQPRTPGARLRVLARAGRVPSGTGTRARASGVGMVVERPDMLLTTPESLESMLVSATVDPRVAAGRRASCGRRRGACVRRRRPRLAPARRPRTTHPNLHRSPSAADRTVGDGGQRARSCCAGSRAAAPGSASRRGGGPATPEAGLRRSSSWTTSGPSTTPPS